MLMLLLVLVLMMKLQPISVAGNPVGVKCFGVGVDGVWCQS